MEQRCRAGRRQRIGIASCLTCSLAAARLGLKTCIYNDAADAPAFQVTPHAISAPYDDLDQLGTFADICDVVTFEFENLPAEAIAQLAQHVPVHPGAHALATTQDRLTEKSFVEKLGLKTAPFFEVSSQAQAREGTLGRFRPAARPCRPASPNRRSRRPSSGPCTHSARPAHRADVRSRPDHCRADRRSRFAPACSPRAPGRRRSPAAIWADR